MFSLFLVLAICVVWILGWTGCLGTLSEQLKTIQSYSAVINSVYGVINAVIVVILGLKSKSKISKQMARQQELSGLMRQDVTTIVDGMENSRCENQERLSLLHNEVSATHNTVDTLRTEQERRHEWDVDAQTEIFENMKTIIKQNEELLENNKRMLEVLDSPSAPVRVTKAGRASGVKTAQHLIKMAFVGAPCTGKTCLIDRWISDKFSLHYRATIGVDFALERIETNIGAANLQLWDVAGAERFTKTPYLQNTVCFVILIDIVNKSSLPAALKWLEKCKKECPNGFSVFMCNKIDLMQHAVLSEDDIAEAVGGNPCFWVSAKTGENVQHALLLVALGAVVRASQTY